MPNESLDPNLSPEDIHRIHSDWQDDSYHERLEKRDAADESDTHTENMFRISEELRKEREAQAPKKSIPVFEIPPKALAGLEKSHQEDVRQPEAETPGNQPQLPAELLPRAVDYASKVPESAQPGVRNYLEAFGADWERVASQAQTTANGPDARSRATIQTEEDRSAQEIDKITKRARRQPGSPASKHHRRIKQANARRRYGESGPSSKALGEI